VYACNHLSYYDTPALYAKLPFQFRILAKAPLWKIPFIGWYLDRSGQVPIDQTSARAGIVSLGRGVKTVQDGLPMVIFPEGGRTATGLIQPMMAGAAYIAIKAQVPLVPLTHPCICAAPATAEADCGGTDLDGGDDGQGR
jgi:1-acyl-sn-glycerol-3-phosphate acyltransferase